jgi:hypothetical protein
MSLEGQVAVHGLGDLRRTLRTIDRANGEARGLPGFRDVLRDAATIVADDARRRAPRGSRPINKGRSPRKRLVDMISPRVRGDVALVRSGGLAKSPMYPLGYRYTRRIEYEGSGGNRSGYGTRGFLGPALEAKSDEVERHMEGVLDKIADQWERNA